MKHLVHVFILVSLLTPVKALASASGGQDRPAITVPTESFFELVREIRRDREKSASNDKKKGGKKKGGGGKKLDKCSIL